MSSAKPPRSLVVLPARGMRDTILLLPALEMLVESLPYAQVSIGYIHPQQADVLNLSTLSVPMVALDGWLGWHNWGWLKNPAQALRSFRHNLHLMRTFDQVAFLEVERLVPRIWVRTALRAGARVLVHAIEEGYLTASRCTYYQRAVAQLLNQKTAGALRLPRLSPKDSDRQFADSLLNRSSLRDKLVVYLNPAISKSQEIKRWPMDDFMTVARGLVQHGVHLLIPGHEDAEARLAARIVDMLPRHAHLLPPLTLGQTAALLAHCALYIGNDTGLTHVALGVNTPTITLYGPTPHELDAGYSPRHTVITNLTDCPVEEGRSTQACPGCERFPSFARPTTQAFSLPYPCLQAIRPADVLTAAERILSSQTNSGPAPKRNC